MFPAPFDYYRAHSVDDAVQALARFGDDARILAGGQSLIPAMRFRLARPSVLVDINAIDELAYVRESDGHLAVGAGTRDFALETAPLIAQRYLLLADTSALVADPVVRQMGTVVGSLCHNDPAGDWPVTALAARAQVSIRTPGGATRTVAIDDFVVDSYTTAVGTGEMAVEVRFPTPGTRTSGSYQKIERKVGDFAAEKLLAGAKPSKDLIRAAMREAEKIADPSPDNRGSVEYKKAMAGVLVGRAIAGALERLGVGGLK